MCRKGNREFRGGYVPVNEAMLLSVISEYGENRSGFKSLVRIFAALCESKALRENSKVDVYRIVNCNSRKKGCRRLAQSEIDEASKKIAEISEKAKGRPERRKRPVSRRILQAIAQGGLSAGESIALLFYSSRRISQGKAMKRLNENERYGRFKYGELKDLTGMERARVSDAIAKLVEKGLLHVVEVHQANVNAYGLCFVDGWLISLFRTMRECVRKAVETVVSVAKKTATPLPENSNTPHTKTATLININIKTLNKENKTSHFEKKETWSETVARLRKRFCLEQSQTIPQTA